MGRTWCISLLLIQCWGSSLVAQTAEQGCLSLSEEVRDDEDLQEESKEHLVSLQADSWLADTETERSQPIASQSIDDKVFRYRPSLKEHTVYVKGDFLYWKANEPETDYVITHFPPQVPNVQISAIGNLKNVPFDWQAGFRVAAGAVLTPDFWNVEAQYTQIDPEGSAHVTASSDDQIRGVWNQITNDAPLIASGHISLHYKTADLILAKRWRIAQRLLMRLDAGLMGAWIDQHFRIFYAGTPPNARETTINMKWEFQGGGVQIGWNYDWFIGKGISLLGWIKGGLLYGYYENKTFTQAVPNPATVEDARLHDHRVATTLQLALGPSWGKMFSHWGVHLFAGYELAMWFNIHEQVHGNPNNQLNGPRTSVHPNAPFSLQGFTGRVEVNF